MTFGIVRDCWQKQARTSDVADYMQRNKWLIEHCDYGYYRCPVVSSESLPLRKILWLFVIGETVYSSASTRTLTWLVASGSMNFLDVKFQTYGTVWIVEKRKLEHESGQIKRSRKRDDSNVICSFWSVRRDRTIIIMTGGLRSLHHTSGLLLFRGFDDDNDEMCTKEIV